MGCFVEEELRSCKERDGEILNREIGQEEEQKSGESKIDRWMNL
jgi:hypothetical protein